MICARVKSLGVGGEEVGRLLIAKCGEWRKGEVGWEWCRGRAKSGRMALHGFFACANPRVHQRYRRSRSRSVKAMLRAKRVGLYFDQSCRGRFVPRDLENKDFGAIAARLGRC